MHTRRVLLPDATILTWFVSVPGVFVTLLVGSVIVATAIIVVFDYLFPGLRDEVGEPLPPENDGGNDREDNNGGG
jgi:hypothetical protein